MGRRRAMVPLVGEEKRRGSKIQPKDATNSCARQPRTLQAKIRRENYRVTKMHPESVGLVFRDGLGRMHLSLADLRARYYCAGFMLDMRLYQSCWSCYLAFVLFRAAIFCCPRADSCTWIFGSWPHRIGIRAGVYYLLICMICTTVII